MDIIECYRLLELTSAANVEDVKASYRRLARRLHPDVNPNNHRAQDQFIRVTEAYKILLKVARAKPAPSPTVTATPYASVEVKVTVSKAAAESAATPPATPAPRPKATPSTPPPVTAASSENNQLKLDAYRQLETFLKTQRVPRAIALVEALRQRLPNDPEVRQWQALIYQRWGRQLITERKLNQARAYLKKALSTDPHNKALWAEVERDFRAIEQVF